MTTPSPTDPVRVRCTNGFTGHLGSAQFDAGELVGWRGDRATRIPRGEAERLRAIIGNVVEIVEDEPEPAQEPVVAEPSEENARDSELSEPSSLPLAPPPTSRRSRRTPAGAP